VTEQTRMSRGLRVIPTCFALEPKNSNSPFGSHPIPPVTVPAILRILSPAGRLPTLSTAQTVALTDSSSSPNHSSGPATFSTPHPCSTPSVASTESKRQSRTAVVVRSVLFSPQTPIFDSSLTPPQVQCTSAHIQWPGRRSL